MAKGGGLQEEKRREEEKKRRKSSEEEELTTTDRGQTLVVADYRQDTDASPWAAPPSWFN
jgi:hypothetical protein